MKYDEASKKIGPKTQLILAFGEEEFFLSSVVKDLLASLKVNSEDRITHWSAADHTSKEMSIYLHELSLTGGRNILFVHDPAKLVMSKLFQDTLEDIPEDSYLCILHPKQKPPKWMEVYKRSGLWVECERIKKPNSWLRRKAISFDLQLSDEQVDLIVERVGTDSLRRLSSELSKLALLKDDQGRVTNREIKSVVVKDNIGDLIPVLDSIYEKNYRKALRLSGEFLFKTGSYLPFISLMQRNVERLCLMLSMSKANLPMSEMVKATKLPHFIIEKELRKARKFASLRQLKRWLRDLCKIERQSRRGQLMTTVMVESLIIEMTRN